MRRGRLLAMVFLSGVALAVGCGDSGDDGEGSGKGGATQGGGAAGDDGGAGTSAAGGSNTGGGSASGGTGATGTGGGTAGTGTGGTGTGGTAGAGTGGTGTGGTAGAGTGGTAGAAACVQIPCQGKIFACGNCADDDGDGLTDMNDPDCLGPCHNAEDKYTGCIAGQNQSPCKADCYFDDDSGSGNDDCYWNWSCDEAYDPKGSTCPTNTGVSVAGTSKSCAELQPEGGQTATCETVCGPLTPNGCDCFGCCELPAGSGIYVYIGSTTGDDGKCEHGSCDLDAANAQDHNACKQCTPVEACLNTCETCELCLGKTQLPPECFPDAGTGGSGGTTSTGGAGGSTSTGGSGGSPCGGQICPTGHQPCGLECQPACPTGEFCLTGCCQPIPG